MGSPWDDLADDALRQRTEERIERFGIPTGAADGARGPEAHPERDPDVLQLELDACKAEIARLRGENERLHAYAADLEEARDQEGRS